LEDPAPRVSAHSWAGAVGGRRRAATTRAMSRSLVFKPGPQSGPVIEKCFSRPLNVFDALYYRWSFCSRGARSTYTWIGVYGYSYLFWGKRMRKKGGK
jgi:hypothetical protein